MQKKTLLIDGPQMYRTLTRMAHEIIERNKGTQDLCFVGIRTRGEPLANMLADRIQVIRC